MAASTLQVLAGLFRPGPEAKIRPVFNWGHWLMGKSTHILAGKISENQFSDKLLE